MGTRIERKIKPQVEENKEPNVVEQIQIKKENKLHTKIHNMAVTFDDHRIAAMLMIPLKQVREILNK